MPISFWLAIVFGVVGVSAGVAWLFARKNVDPADRDSVSFVRVLKLSAIVLGVLALLFTLMASANTVPVRNVGIVTSFNKPTGETTGSGLKFVAPWKKIAEWDASIQTADHGGDACVNVRIGSLATACVENKVRWQVKPEAAPQQYQDFKGDFDKNMRQNYIEAELQNALNDTFSDYNPLNTIDLKTGNTKFDGSELAEEVKQKLQARVSKDVIVTSVVIPLVKHDQKTEENIKQFQDVIAQNRILEQRKTNATTEKEAAELLKDLPLAYSLNKCLDLAKDLGKEPGLCFGGASPIWTANK